MEQAKEFQLYRIAENQAGYFTLAQAREIDLRRNQIYRYVKRNRFQRAAHGVYRFVQFPTSRFEEIHVAVLSAGEDAVVGYETALYVYELSDLIPNEIHLILPRTSSRRRPDIRMHTNQLDAADVTTWQGLPITTVARTICDVARTHHEPGQIELAIRQALRRGMTTREAIVQQARRLPENTRREIRSLLEAIEV
jgi:predicted transcriptional regulator of viral defense system